MFLTPYNFRLISNNVRTRSREFVLIQKDRRCQCTPCYRYTFFKMNWCWFSLHVCLVEQFVGYTNQKKMMHFKQRSISNGHEQWNWIWFEAAFTVQCATVLKKSAACLIAAIMDGVKFYRKSDSLRQKKAKRKGSAGLKNRWCKYWCGGISR